MVANKRILKQFDITRLCWVKCYRWSFTHKWVFFEYHVKKEGISDSLLALRAKKDLPKAVKKSKKIRQRFLKEHPTR